MSDATTPPLIIHAPQVQVRDQGAIAGRGVFSSRDYLVGELIEVAPVLLIDAPHNQLPIELQSYVFSWQALTGTGVKQAVALGYGSLYNHANPASLRYEGDAERLVIRYFAARNIKQGEELTINYNWTGGGVASEDDNWFRNHSIEPLHAG